MSFIVAGLPCQNLTCVLWVSFHLQEGCHLKSKRRHHRCMFFCLFVNSQLKTQQIKSSSELCNYSKKSLQFWWTRKDKDYFTGRITDLQLFTDPQTHVIKLIICSPQHFLKAICMIGWLWLASKNSVYNRLSVIGLKRGAAISRTSKNWILFLLKHKTTVCALYAKRLFSGVYHEEV